MKPMDDVLANYRHLVARVDALCQGIEAALHGQITCTEGCSSCCTSVTLFPVEAAALRAALDNLPAEQAAVARRHVAEHAEEERCPLLEHHRCLLYAARPIICRTHGLPILYTDNNEQRVDCCPHNLEQCDSLPGTAVIDLERLNALLVAVNALFLSQTEAPEFPERLSIAEALLGSPLNKGD
ncbi:MAG TPA: YkgJ family cysteine cluster protein [Desulfuromonadaceae bacterium]